MSKRIYQRTIPVFVASFFSVIFIVQFFSVKYPPLDSLKAEATQWGIVASAVLLLYTQVIFLSGPVRTLVQRKAKPRQLFEAAVFIATVVFFVVLAGVERNLSGGPIFTMIFLSIIGYITSGNAGLYYWSHSFIAFRVISAMSTVESVIFGAVWLITFLSYITSAMYLLPQLGSVADWINMVPHVAVQRVAVAAAGVGTVIMAYRALVGREPGLIEMEMETSEAKVEVKR